MSRTENSEVSVKARRTVFENSKFRVFSDHVVDSSGNEVQDFLVVAPKVFTPPKVTGVSIIPVIGDSIVLIRMFRHAVDRFVLEAPGGFVDPNETPEQAALRELKEEAGLVCEPERLIPLGTCMPDAGLLAAQRGLFAALDCREDIRTETAEIGLGKCERFTKSEAADLLRNMALEDATTAVGLHRLFLRPEMHLLK